MITSAQDIFSDNQAVKATGPSANVIDLGRLPRTVFAMSAWATVIPLAVQITGGFRQIYLARNRARNLRHGELRQRRKPSSRPLLMSLMPSPGISRRSTSCRRGVNKRYMRMMYTITGTAPTTGKFFAALTKGFRPMAKVVALKVGYYGKKRPG